MPNSLKTKLSKLKYKGQITDEEYRELIAKLDGHDTEIRAEARTKVLDKILKEITFEEKWLYDAIRADKGNYGYNINKAFSGLKNSLRKMKEQK